MSKLEANNPQQAENNTTEQPKLEAKLLPLPIGKTKVFYTPLEGKDVIVRTGTDEYKQEMESIASCIKQAIEPKFVTLERTERESKVTDLLKEPLTLNEYREQIIILIDDFYKKNDKNPKLAVVKSRLGDYSPFLVIAQLFTFKMFETKIFADLFAPRIADKQELKKILIDNTTKCCTEFFNKVKELDDKKRKQCISKIVKVVTIISEEADQGGNILDLKSLCKKLERNIYFFDSVTRLPIFPKKFETELTLPLVYKKSILILVLENGYELLGRLHEDKRVQRDFTHKDRIIKRVHSFLYDHEKLERKYPKLMIYIKDRPKKKYRKSRRSRRNDRHKESESNSSHTSE
jgi:hypothetical protein